MALSPYIPDAAKGAIVDANGHILEPDDNEDMRASIIRGPDQQAVDWVAFLKEDYFPGRFITGNGDPNPAGYTTTTTPIILKGTGLQMEAPFTLAVGTWPALSHARTTTRAAWRWATATALASGATFDSAGYYPDSRVLRSDTALGCQMLQTIATTTSVAPRPNTIVELLDLPVGWTINTVTIRTKGVTANGDGTGTYQIVRWQEDGDMEDVSAVVLDNHTPANWTTTISTVIAAMSNDVVERGYQYGVVIVHPYDPSLAAVRIYSFATELSGSSIEV